MAIVALLMASSLFVAEVHAEGPSAGSRALSVTEKGFDVVLLRPLGFAALLVGGAAYIPAVVLALPSGKDGISAVTDSFIMRPYDNVFKRQLGDF